MGPCGTTEPEGLGQGVGRWTEARWGPGAGAGPLPADADVHPWHRDSTPLPSSATLCALCRHARVQPFLPANPITAVVAALLAGGTALQPAWASRVREAARCLRALGLQSVSEEACTSVVYAHVQRKLDSLALG